MSSALAMILTAAMAVPGNGPEMVSAEMEQGLDLRGEWEGTLRSEKGRVYPVIIDDGTSKRCGFPALTLDGCSVRFEVTEARDGKFQVNFMGDLCLGTYLWEANQLVICIRGIEVEEDSPFPAGVGQVVILLCRVKPRK